MAAWIKGRFIALLVQFMMVRWCYHVIKQEARSILVISLVAIAILLVFIECGAYVHLLSRVDAAHCNMLPINFVSALARSDPVCFIDTCRLRR